MFEWKKVRNVGDVMNEEDRIKKKNNNKIRRKIILINGLCHLTAHNQNNSG